MQTNSTFSKQQQRSVNILTMVRIRPLLELQRDEHQSIKYIDNKTIEIKLSSGKRIEQVCHVFDQKCTQKDIFDEIKPLISKCQTGYNITVLTYGQTGSGKTYTMFGIDKTTLTQLSSNNIQKIKQQTFLRKISIDQNYIGIIPRTINYIFNSIVCQPKKYIKIFCSFVQLYNQNIVDLLDFDHNYHRNKYFIHQNVNDGVYVQGIIQAQVTDVDECLQLMQKGQRSRIVRQTSMNLKSSRSHTLFQLIIEQVFPTTKTYRRMKVNLCDLAGSQKIHKIQQINPSHFDQLKNINLSLTTLGKVISCLCSKYKKPPFRQSKLTRLLQDSLGGNTYTAIIATITSKSNCLEQSLNTLHFLERAKQIKTLITTKILNSNPDIQNLQKQITYLKDVLKMKRNGMEIDVDMADRVKKLQHQNQKLKQIVNQDLLKKLIKQNTHLKQQLQRKTNQQILDSRSKYAAFESHKYSSPLQNKFSSEQLSDLASSFSASKPIPKYTQQRYLSTKTHSTKPPNPNPPKKHKFPLIKPLSNKNIPSLILQKILQIQKVKKQNKIHLQQELSKIGKTSNCQKGSSFTPINKYRNHFLNKF